MSLRSRFLALMDTYVRWSRKFNTNVPAAPSLKKRTVCTWMGIPDPESDAERRRGLYGEIAGSFFPGATLGAFIWGGVSCVKRLVGALALCRGARTELRLEDSEGMRASSYS